MAARASIRRLKQKGRVAVPFRDFHLIIPPEYQKMGCLPADQYVPQLMDYIGIQYCAGLLSAAQFHGASHQKPQVFQVVVVANRPGIRCGEVVVQFIARRNVPDVTCIQTNTARGILRVSSPEATAFDLIGYSELCGGLSNVATVLGELTEQLDAKRLVRESGHSPLPWLQRLGFLLDRVGAGAREYVPLRTCRPVSDVPRDRRWKILDNEAVELDLVQATSGPPGPIVDSVRGALDPWLGSPRRIIKEGKVSLLYRMRSEGQPSFPMRLKVEVNTNEQFALLGLVRRPLRIESRWFESIADIVTYELDELLATRLRALYQRKKCRDLFDLWQASRRAQPDPARIVGCFSEYLSRTGLSVSRAEFEANLQEKLTDPEFPNDIEPLLAPGVLWDPAEAVEYLRRRLLPNLPGEPWIGGT